MSGTDNDLLAIALGAAVPLRVAEYLRQGGPGEDDRERARRFAPVLGAEGDALQFRGKSRGEAAELFNRLADALAVMAFQPGGVTAFGEKWEA